MENTQERTNVLDTHGGTDKSKHASMSSDTCKEPFWKRVVELGDQIPEEEWTKVPNDASINFKHYLYGTPKKNV